MKLAIAAISGLVLASACTSAPDYRQANRTGAQGYSSQMLETNRFRVSYTGDKNQDAAEVQNLALLRAAELTMEQGGDWFEVVNDATSSDVDVRKRLSDGGFETRTEIRRECGLLGCTTRGYPVTVRDTDVQTDTTVIYDHAIEIIVHGGEKPDGNPRAYDAAETAANLRATLD